MKLKILVFLLALLQPLTSYLSSSSMSSILMDRLQIPIVSPATYAFSIWSIIILSSLFYGIHQLMSRKNSELFSHLAPYAALVFASFSLWLLAAEYNLLPGTVVIFLFMGYGLYKLFPKVVSAARSNKFSLWEKNIVYGTWGLYCGWATVAIFPNLAALIKFSGISDRGDVGLLWQTGVLVVATATVLYLQKKFQWSSPYFAAVLWAYVAIVVGTLERGTVTGYLPYVAMLATTIIIFSFIKNRFIIQKLKKLLKANSLT